MNDKYEKHESWGMIGAYRRQGDSNSFFQSDVPCKNHIAIVIKTAQKVRDLSHEFVMGDKLVCEVKLTPMQWAEMLTNMNCGDGVPCTFEFIQGKGMIDFFPEKDKVEMLIEETNETIDCGKTALKNAIDKAVNLINTGKLSKKAGEELLSELNNANSKLRGSSLDFIKRQAKEQITNMVVQAKANIGAYIDQKIYSTGLKELDKLRLGVNENERV